MAWTSLRVPLSVRMLPRMRRMTSSLSSPRLSSRTDWKRRPSCRNSREPTCMLLGTGPPMSLQCALTDTKPVKRPSQNTGAVMATSLR